jgi:hypothetical protein
MKRLGLRGKRFLEKVLDTGKKLTAFDPLIREFRKKPGAELLHSGKHFGWKGGF